MREPNSAYREIGDMNIDDGASDAEIVTQSLQAPSVFAVLFDRHAAAIHQYARRRAGSGVADDVMAETFLVAFDKRHRFDPAIMNARPWLLGIATRLLARHARAESRRWAAYARAAPRSGDRVDIDVDALVARLDAQSRTGELARTLAALHQRDRDVLLLYGFADLTYEQIGQALQIPVGTVRSRLNRARRQIQATLSDPADPDEPRRPDALKTAPPNLCPLPRPLLTTEVHHERS